MSSRQTFERELSLYRRRHGDTAADRVYLVLAAIVRWTRRHGHGSCVLNAIDGRLGSKLKTTTIEDVTLDSTKLEGVDAS